MKIGIYNETSQFEKRVAATPDTVKRLVEAGHELSVATGAGEQAGFSDTDYIEVGAHMSDEVSDLFVSTDLLLLVGKPSYSTIAAMARESAVIGMLDARRDTVLLDELARAHVTSFAMDLVPRIARAQSMDVLSSQASLAGYKAALMAADSIGRFFPMMMTAAGTIPPARVLVIGAGVAGLQAIATSKRLGAVVEAFDVRAAAGEQVRSLGGTFIEPTAGEDAETAGGYARAQSRDENEAQRKRIAPHVARADVVITTAAIPGREAPILVTDEMVSQMRRGSVIIDLAAQAGGNVEATKPGELVMRYGVAIHGPINIPSSMPHHASQMYSKNIEAFLNLLVGEDLNIDVDLEDEVIGSMCVTHNGEVRAKAIA